MSAVGIVAITLFPVWKRKGGLPEILLGVLAACEKIQSHSVFADGRNGPILVGKSLHASKNVIDILCKDVQAVGAIIAFLS